MIIGTGKAKILRGFFVSVFTPQPAWEDKGWRTMREQRVRDNLEMVEVSNSMSLDKGQAGRAVRSM